MAASGANNRQQCGADGGVERQQPPASLARYGASTTDRPPYVTLGVGITGRTSIEPKGALGHFDAHAIASSSVGTSMM